MNFSDLSTLISYFDLGSQSEYNPVALEDEETSIMSSSSEEEEDVRPYLAHILITIREPHISYCSGDVDEDDGKPSHWFSALLNYEEMNYYLSSTEQITLETNMTCEVDDLSNRLEHIQGDCLSGGTASCYQSYVVYDRMIIHLIDPQYMTGTLCDDKWDRTSKAWEWVSEYDIPYLGYYTYYESNWCDIIKKIQKLEPALNAMYFSSLKELRDYCVNYIALGYYDR